MTLPDKRSAFEALRERVRGRLDEAVHAQRATQAGAMHAETRAEGPKDMRSTEASYLARGLAERAESLAEALRVLEAFEAPVFVQGDPIAVGALVAVDDGGGDGPRAYLLVPAGGGETLEIEGAIVRTLTPIAPLGRLLLGCHVGDSVDASLPGGRRELIVSRVG